jgi:hypothetical protein
MRTEEWQQQQQSTTQQQQQQRQKEEQQQQQQAEALQYRRGQQRQQDEMIRGKLMDMGLFSVSGYQDENVENGRSREAGLPSAPSNSSSQARGLHFQR